MNNAQARLLANQLRICRQETLNAAGRVPETNRLRQLRDGKAHPLWLVGHLTNTANTVALQWALGGESLVPKGFGRKFAPDFAGGNPVTSNAADYPGWDEVVDLYGKVLDAVIARTEQLSDDDLPKPLGGNIPEPMLQFFKTTGNSLTIMVLHDSYHRGQIGLLAKLGG
jgi:hypothetical protein